MSGNGWDCDVFGATITTDRFNQDNQAYEFDGSNDYIFTQAELDWEALGLNNTMTISVWLNPYTIGNGNSQYWPGWALNNRDVDNVTYWTLGFGGYHSNDQKGAFTVFNDNYKTSSVLQFNQWYHIVAVLENASTVKIYLNGNLENTYALSNRLPSGALGKLAIGKNGQSNGIHNEYLWKGKIDDIRIYDVALTNIDVQALYHENRGGYTQIPFGTYENYPYGIQPTATDLDQYANEQYGNWLTDFVTDENANDFLRVKYEESSTSQLYN